MSKQLITKPLVLICLLIALAMLSGCTPGKYVLQNIPTEDTKAFKNIEVSKVEVGITKDRLEPGTPIELKTAIIEEIQKKGIYEKVAAEFDSKESTLQIKLKIVGFDKGSQFERYFIGFGAGEAHLDVQCKFLNKETEEVFAEGTFTGKISFGFLGGSADQKKMSKYVAKQIVNFLQKGK